MRQAQQRHSDVLIVGGGIVGCSIALRLAQAGLRPLVLERSIPGAEASSAAAGMLVPALETHPNPAILALALRSRDLHADLAQELRESHGIDVGFRRCGGLLLSCTAAESARLHRRAATLAAQQVACELLDATLARRCESQLGPAVEAALAVPAEAQVVPNMLLQALAIAAETAGARFRAGVTVRGILHQGGRVRGVTLAEGQIEAETVVVAAGSWSLQLRDLGLPPGTIFPVRGQMLRCQSRPPLARRILFAEQGYLLTRPHGEVLCGSTLEAVGFERNVTVDGLSRIMSHATTLVPALKQAAVDGYWSNFRPATADGLPLIGALQMPGLYIASGHFRNGILWAPLTAELITAALLTRPSPAEAAAFDPQRLMSPLGEP